jgi:hypothetical protein
LLVYGHPALPVGCRLHMRKSSGLFREKQKEFHYRTVGFAGTF